MTGLEAKLEFVEDGQQLMDYLEREGARPDLILLDLNMPRIDGRDALRMIKENPRLRSIPVVVLTTSKSEDDVRGCYDLGANSYVTKPSHFDDLITSMQKLEEYWSQVVRLPGRQTV